MRLTEVLPELPEQEGNLWSHNTGGEHASKFSGDHRRINALLQTELVRRDGEPTRQFADHDFINLLLDNTNNTVIIVDRQPLNRIVEDPQQIAHDREEDKVGVKGVIATTIASHTFDFPSFERIVSVDEMVVHPALRQRGIAGYMLEKVVESFNYGELRPTELAISTDIYNTEEWFVENLIQAGFRHQAQSNGHSPAMWLPGNHVYANVGDGAPGDEARVRAAMPDTWNGYIEFCDDPMYWFEQYHKGEKVGSALMTEDTGRDEQDEFLRDYILLDAGGEQVDRVTVHNAQEALRLLLNNYEFVK